MASSSISSSSLSPVVSSPLTLEPFQNSILQLPSFHELQSDACSLHNTSVMWSLIYRIGKWIKQDPNSIDPQKDKLLMNRFSYSSLPDHLKAHLERFETDVIGLFTTLDAYSIKLFGPCLIEALKQLRENLNQKYGIKYRDIQFGSGLDRLFNLQSFQKLPNEVVGGIIEVFARNPKSLRVRKILEDAFKKNSLEKEFPQFCVEIRNLGKALIKDDKRLEQQLNDLGQSNRDQKEYECTLDSLVRLICKTQKKPETYLNECLSKHKNNPRIFDRKILILRDVSNNIFFKTVIKKAERTGNEFKFSLSNRQTVKIQVTESGGELSIYWITIKILKEISFLRLIDKPEPIQIPVCRIQFPLDVRHGQDKQYQLQLRKKECSSNSSKEKRPSSPPTIWSEEISKLKKEESYQLTTIELKGTQHRDEHKLARLRIQAEKRLPDHYYHRSQPANQKTEEEELTVNDFASFKIIEKAVFRITEKDQIHHSIALEDGSLDKSLLLQDEEDHIKNIERNIICTLLLNHSSIKKMVSDFLDGKLCIKDLSPFIQAQLQEISKIRAEIFEHKTDLLELFRKILFDAFYLSVLPQINEFGHVKSLRAITGMRLLRQAVGYIDGIEDKKRIFIIGPTGVGKSATSGFLTGAEVKIEESGRAVYEGDPAHLPIIGHGDVSQTIFAQGHIIKESPDSVVVDCPGFLETRGRDYEMCTNVSLDRAFNTPGSIQACIILIDYHSFGDRSAHFYSLIRLINERFNGLFDSEDSLFPDNVFLLVTKCQNITDADLKNLRAILDGSYFSGMIRVRQSPSEESIDEEQERTNRIWSKLARMGAEGKIHPLIFDKKKTEVEIRQTKIEEFLEDNMMESRDFLRIYQAPSERPLIISDSCKMGVTEQTRLKEGVSPFRAGWNLFSNHQDTIDKKIREALTQKGEWESALASQKVAEAKMKADVLEAHQSLSDANIGSKGFIEKHEIMISDEVENIQKEEEKIKNHEKLIIELSSGHCMYPLSSFIFNRSPFYFTAETTAPYSLDPAVFRDYAHYLSKDEEFEFDVQSTEPEHPQSMLNSLWNWLLSFISPVQHPFQYRINSRIIETLEKARAEENDPFIKQDGKSCSYAWKLNEDVTLCIEGEDFEIQQFQILPSQPLSFTFKASPNSKQKNFFNPDTNRISFNLYVSNKRVNQAEIEWFKSEIEKSIAQIHTSEEMIKSKKRFISELGDLVSYNEQQIKTIEQTLQEVKKEGKESEKREIAFERLDVIDMKKKTEAVKNATESFIKTTEKIRQDEDRLNSQVRTIEELQFEKKLLDGVVEEYRLLSETLRQLEKFYPGICVP